MSNSTMLPVLDVQGPAQDHMPMTFGAEFEFIIATLPPKLTATGKTITMPSGKSYTPRPQKSKRPDPQPEDGRQVYDIIDRDSIERFPGEKLQVENGQVQWHIRNTLNDFFGERKALADHDESSSPDMQRSENFWVVKYDSTVNPPNDETSGYVYKSVELVSPAYLFNPDAVQMVGSVLDKLSSTYRIHLPPSSSVHIHVGFANQGFSFRELQNILATWWTFEEQFFSCVAEHRHTEYYCKKMRDDDALRIDRYIRKAPNRVRAGLDVIYGLRDENPQKLNDLFYKTSASVRLHGIYRVSPKKTIEVRIHEGCFDPVEASQWIKLCCGLVYFASFVTTEQLRPWLEAHADNENDAEDFPVGDLLRAMKYPALAEHFEGKIEKMNNTAPGPDFGKGPIGSQQ